MTKKKKDAVQWEEPPARSVRNREGKYDEFFDALRSKPGKWALFPGKTTTSTATSINNGKYANIDKHEFEAVFRTKDDGTTGVWVRTREAGTLEFSTKKDEAA